MARQAPTSQNDSMLDMLRQFVRDLFDPYRPELHYMRGPGPKWHAKHNPVMADAPIGNPGMSQATL